MTISALLKGGDLMSRVRDDFPIYNNYKLHEKLVYLDSAATTLKPKSVIDKICYFYNDITANVHRGKHFLSEMASVHFEGARCNVAKFMGCQGNEIIFTSGATDSINLIADGLGFSQEQFVLGHLDSHHSNVLPWAKRNRFHQLDYDEDGNIDFDEYEKLLDRKPVLVTLTHRSNVTGLYLPVEKMAKMAKEVGAIVVVDAAQSIAHRPLSLNGLNADYIVFSSHKMLGPSGLGVLCGKVEMLERLKPSRLGGGVVDWVDEGGGHRLRKLPHRLEAGTPNIEGVFGLSEAVNYLRAIGAGLIADHDVNLAHVLVSKVNEREYIKCLYPHSGLDRGATLSFSLKNISALSDLSKMLSDSYGIMCRTGHLCAQPLVNKSSIGEVMRVSAYIYNTVDDINYFFESLDELYDSLV